MTRRLPLVTLCVGLMLLLSITTSWGRGFGGGGFGGGAHGGGGFGGGGLGGGSFGGGGFGGGVSRGAGGFGGGNFGAGGLGGGFDRGGAGGAGFGAGGGGFDRGAGGLGAGGFGGGGEGGFGGPGAGGFDRGAGAPGAGGSGAGAFGRGAGAPGAGADRFSTPSRGQLGSFLGMPSDGGLHNPSSLGVGAGNVGVGTNLGVGGGRPGYGAGVGGPASGVGALPGRGAGGAGGPASGAGALPGAGVGRAGGPGSVGVGVGNIGVGTDLGIGGGRPGYGAGLGGPASGIGVRPGVGAGRAGVGLGGFTPVAASSRYTAATAVRGNFTHWGVYGAGWYTAHPGAWYAAGWGAGAAWRPATWASVGAWMDYYPSQPAYYDYGNNVTYQDNSVYVNGQDAGTAEQYYDQAAGVAATGAQAAAPADGEWLPLGVFALSKTDDTKSDLALQLAVNKQGVIRGNYTDAAMNSTQAVQGSVDKQSQRVAFTIGDNRTTVVETGLYNLTKDEAPCVIHFGKDRTEQWLLVRLKQPPAGQGPQQ